MRFHWLTAAETTFRRWKINLTQCVYFLNSLKWIFICFEIQNWKTIFSRFIQSEFLRLFIFLNHVTLWLLISSWNHRKHSTMFLVIYACFDCLLDSSLESSSTIKANASRSRTFRTWFFAFSVFTEASLDYFHRLLWKESKAVHRQHLMIYF